MINRVTVREPSLYLPQNMDIVIADTSLNDVRIIVPKHHEKAFFVKKISPSNKLRITSAHGITIMGSDYITIEDPCALIFMREDLNWENIS